MYSRWWKFFWGALAVVAGFYVARHILLVILIEGERVDLDILVRAARRFVVGESMYRIDDPFEHTKPPLLMGILFPLASLPQFWVRKIWDLVIFIMPVLILREALLAWGPDLGGRWRWRPVVLTWALMYPFWYRESEYGQFNLFIFWLILVGARWIRGPDRRLQIAAGVLAALTIVIKPTQLYLVPWLAIVALDLPSLRSRLRYAFAGSVLLVVLLALSYFRLRSPAALIDDHLEWLRFVPTTTAKHLMGANNYGLPTLFSRVGLHSWGTSSAFFPITLLMTSVVVWLLRRRRELALDCSVLLMLAFSPMSWRANFGVFVVLAYRLSLRIERSGRDLLAWVGLLCILLFAKASEYWLGVPLMNDFGYVAAPLWLMSVAIYCGHFCRDQPSGVLA